MEECETPSCIFATQIRRLPDIINLLHTFVNKGHARLAGDSPVKAKAADAENHGDPGSGDEGGKKKTPNLPVSHVAFQKLVDKTDDGCVSFHDSIRKDIL